MSDTASDFSAFTDRWLDRLVPLAPLDMGVEPCIDPIHGVRAVLFDIYGTLLVSESGDVDITRFRKQAVRGALEGVDLTGEPSRVVELFRATIKEHHARSAHPHPEVDIVAVWADALEKLEREGTIRSAAKADPARIAFAFELASNAVWPMPGLTEALDGIAARVPLGIVSNAQFFTPIVLRHFVSGWPFAADLTFYSYQSGRAKPDPWLFHRAAEALQRLGIMPSETIYVGNDMLNDVAAASVAGFRTVLFAGDRRSLRQREDRAEAASVRPDRVVTALAQILGLLG